MTRIITVLGILAWLGCQPSASAAAPPGPVLVELFTSEGCSSCPPADRELQRLLADPALKDRVVPLAFHVDYWNDLGWRDPFSSKRWSERQRAYGRRLGLRGAYTPQVVVDGVTDVVGSRRSALRRAIRAAAQRPKTATAKITSATATGDRVEVELEVTSDRAARVLVAVYESGLRQRVPRGENAGRTLRHDRVVRQLVAATRVPGDSEAHRERVTARLSAPAAGRRLGVALIVQSPAGRVLAVSDAPLASAR